jgi:hypothetical protein
VFPTLLVWARVGSGTYLRSLARDVGAALGVPAHLAGLVRTRAGRFSLTGSVALGDLADAAGRDDLDALDLPRAEVDARTAKDLRDGKRPERGEAGRLVVTHGGALVAVVDGDGQSGGWCGRGPRRARANRADFPGLCFRSGLPGVRPAPNGVRADSGKRGVPDPPRPPARSRGPLQTGSLVVCFSCLAAMVLLVLLTSGMAARTSTRKRW